MIRSLVFIEVTMIFCIVTAFKFISSLENCIYRSVSHVWRNSILNGPLCLAYFRLSDCKDDAWSVRHAKIQSRWKKGAVSFLQSVLPFYFHFCAFCIFADPTISEPGTGYYDTAVIFVARVAILLASAKRRALAGGRAERSVQNTEFCRLSMPIFRDPKQWRLP